MPMTVHRYISGSFVVVGGSRGTHGSCLADYPPVELVLQPDVVAYGGLSRLR
jgi:hypothetical protein